MSLAVLSETAAGALAAAAAAVALWRNSIRQKAVVRHAYRWFAVVAVAWGAGLVAQQALIGPLGGTAVPLTFGDLLSLLALPAMVAGFAALAAAGHEHAEGRAALLPRDAVARLADGYILAAALFIIGWITLFGSIYHRSGDGAGTFGLALLHPLADLAVAGVALHYAVRAGRRGIAPFLALIAVTVSDALSVGAKVNAASPGGWAQLMQLAAFCLLGAAPLVGTGLTWLPRRGPVRGMTRLARRGQAQQTGGLATQQTGGLVTQQTGGLVTRQTGGLVTQLAVLAAAAAALVIIVWALAGGSSAEPAVAVAGGIAVLALTARIAGLLVSDRAASVTQQESDRQFRDLADRITDAVLVCDLDGTIGYASPAVAEYGYSAEKLDGMTLADLIHPEDLPGGIRSVREAACTTPATRRFPCRVRSSDGTWRHVEATVSRQHYAGSAERLLITARDVSDQVALRRQVTHLTFHDGLTGLPNRAYLEERAKDVLSAGRQAASELVAGEMAGDLVAGDLVAGDLVAGDLVAGDLVGGDLVGGDLVAGDLVGGDLVGGDLVGGDLVGGDLVAGDLVGGDLVGGELATSELAAGESRAVTGAIFLDLDGFTGVNDSVGHGAGDLLLAQAARRLRAAVPPHETVARWGGDEFAVLVENAASAQEVVDIAERLAGSIAAAAFRVADRDVSLTASIGVAFADADGPGYLLRNADVAMSRAKESGGGRVEVFAAHMHADVVRRLELASDLRRAITDDDLRLDYQPVVDLSTSAVTGVEALVRWWRAGQAIPPEEFLDVAEDSGLIVPLGDWVLREACAQAAAWRASGWAIGMSVNFSLRQMSAARFGESVLAVLHDTGLPAEALTLEVTERVLIEGSSPMVDGLAELRGRGVRLAIDDFGAGHASLAYLRRLPVDIIKIDPSFVAGLGLDPTLAMLTRTIVRVGHDLGIEVVAEGIERPEQLKLLREMGCGLGQGYLVARPMTAVRVEALAGGGALAPGAGVASDAGPSEGLAGGGAAGPAVSAGPATAGEARVPEGPGAELTPSARGK